MKIHVTCALMVREGKVLCTQRGPTMALPFQWEFPGGKIEEGETAEECILREIKEELNLEIRVLERGPSAELVYEDGKVLELIPFICEVVEGALELKEHSEARWCGVEELEVLEWAQADLGIVDWWRGRNSIEAKDE
jgi:8-oxo-dGTP diphosphatase